MYVPAHFSADDAEVRELLAGCGAADLVTATPRGLIATYLPVLYETRRPASMVITRVEAKAKMSQNRPEADIAGVIEGYRGQGDAAMTEAVSRQRVTNR